MATKLPAAESLTIEFKSDRDRLSDDDLAATVVCLANTEGGEIYLGVEDDGRVTGLHPAHRNVGGLPALIANRTVPPVSVRVNYARACNFYTRAQIANDRSRAAAHLHLDGPSDRGVDREPRPIQLASATGRMSRFSGRAGSSVRRAPVASS